MTEKKAKNFSNFSNVLFIVTFAIIIASMLITFIFKLEKQEKLIIFIVSITLMIIAITMTITSHIILKKADDDKEKKTPQVDKPVKQTEELKKPVKQKTVIILNDDLKIKILSIVKIALFTIFAICLILTLILYLSILLSYFAIITGSISIISLTFAFYTDKKIENIQIKSLIKEINKEKR